MTVLVVALAVLALAPWWAARARTERRLTVVAAPAPGRTTTVPSSPGRRVTARVAAMMRGRASPTPGTGGTANLIDVGVLLGLLVAAVSAGSTLPGALRATGRAVGGVDGAALERVAAGLVLGASWQAAWVDAPARLDVVRRALGPAWEHGAAPAEALRVASRQLRSDRQAAAARTAAQLGVRLVVPLGLCYLPAFVLIGLVPLLISLGAGILG